MSDAAGAPHFLSPSPKWFQRRRIDELMDAPDLQADQHERALTGLRRINAASGVIGQLAARIAAFARQRRLTHLRLLDVASGGGDVPLGVAQMLKGHGISIDLTLVDRSETALHQSAALAAASRVEVETLAADAVRSLPDRHFDVVTNSLFLHHLDGADVVAALANMRRAGRLLLISDLRRSVTGWAVAWAGCRVLSRSPIVHFDGPVSVRGAWTIDELRQLAEAAGLSGVTIHRQWPFRMLLRSEAP